MHARKSNESSPGQPAGINAIDSVGQAEKRYPALIRAIECQAASEGKTLQEVGDVLGVTAGYLLQLKSGVRKTEHISREFAHSVAGYCKKPAISILLMAGRLQINDFSPAGQGQSSVLESELDAVAQDELLGALIPPSAWSAPDDLKRYLLFLFYEAKGQLVRNQPRLPLMIEDLQRAASLMDDFEVLQSALSKP